MKIKKGWYIVFVAPLMIMFSIIVSVNPKLGQLLIEF